MDNIAKHIGPLFYVQAYSQGNGFSTTKPWKLFSPKRPSFSWVYTYRNSWTKRREAFTNSLSVEKKDKLERNTKRTFETTSFKIQQISQILCFLITTNRLFKSIQESFSNREEASNRCHRFEHLQTDNQF